MGLGVGWGDINIRIDINMNIDIHIIINMENIFGVGDHFQVLKVLPGPLFPIEQNQGQMFFQQGWRDSLRCTFVCRIIKYIYIYICTYIMYV